MAKTGSYTDLLNRPVIPDKTSQLSNDSRFVATDANGNVVLTGTLTATKVYNAVYNDYAGILSPGRRYQRETLLPWTNQPIRNNTSRPPPAACVWWESIRKISLPSSGGRTLSPGDDILKTNLPTYIPVALADRVPVRMYGKARKGGWVIPSEMPGVGRMALPGESITQAVGQIVKDDTAENVRLVKILVREWKMKYLRRNINTVFLMLGNSCNMNCAYCLQHPLVHKALTREVNPEIYDFLEEVTNENTRPLHLQFYGGEPLLYFLEPSRKWWLR